MENESLNGKVIVITGASSGFGKGAALQFAERGASLALAARRDQLLEELARQWEGIGGRAIAAPADVSSLEDVKALPLPPSPNSVALTCG